MKIGKDILKFKKKGTGLRRGPIVYGYYKKLLSEIKKIKTVEQLDIVGKMIQGAYLNGRITFEENNGLYSKLNERASKVGEKKIAVKLGTLEFGGEKKGKIV